MLQKIKPGYLCAVKSCNTRNDGSISFFRFPKGDLARCKEWLRLCSRNELMNQTDENYFYNNLRVCAKHFENNMFLNDLHNRLQPHAKPILQICNILQSIVVVPKTIDIQQSMEQPSCSYVKSADVPKTIYIQRSVEQPSCSYVKSTDITPSEPAVLFETTPRLHEDADVVIHENRPASSSVIVQTPQFLSAHTPRKEKLKRKYKVRQEQLRTIKKRKLDNKPKFTIDDFKEMCDTFLTESTAKFVKAQVNLKASNPHGRRYSDAFKQFALQIFFTSPKSYRLLMKSFTLPSVRTLQRITHCLDFKVGLNDFVFEILKVKMQSLSDNEKICSICIDEMSLKAYLFYNLSKDAIVGFHDEGEGKEFRPAQSVMVVMARGLFAKWKQPLAFYFSNTTCPKHTLKKIIENAIKKLITISCVNPVVLVSDQGQNFSDLAKLLNITEEKSYFLVEEHKIYFMYDACHLIKSIRNNLMKYDIHYNNKVASWDHIKVFYNIDKEKTLRIAHKLTNSHINPTRFERMRVKLATQVLSESVAIGISTYITIQVLPSSAEGTATFLEKFDKLFDLFNSITTKNVKKYNLAFMGSEYQYAFLEEMRKLLKTLVVRDKVHGKNVTNSLRCIKGWCISINSLIELHKDLKKDKGMKFLLTRRLNTDCLENFFAAVRSQGGNSTNPTPQLFINTFKKLFSLNYITHSDKANCEDDHDTFLNQINSFNEINVTPRLPQEVTSTINVDLGNCSDFREMDLLTQNALTYVCGYLFKKCLNRHQNCSLCIDESKRCTELTSTNIFSSFKAYETKDKKTFGNLCMPGPDFIAFVEEMEKIFNQNFETLSILPNVIQNLSNLCNEINYVPPCPQFPKEYVVKLFNRMRIYHALKRANSKFRSVPRKDRKIVHILNL